MNTYEAIVLTKALQPAWSHNTIQLRCIAKDGTETLIQATDGALEVLRNVEPLRAYIFYPRSMCQAQHNSRQDRHLRRLPNSHAAQLQDGNRQEILACGHPV